MIAKSNFSSSVGKYGRCPVPKTHRRLNEAHLLWHQTLERYHDPDSFRANLNATIEALRNVTFVLQNEKAVFAQFDEWYGPWQARLKADNAAEWLHDARTTVVHQGELESHSTAEVRLVTWRDEVVARLSVPAEASPSVVLQNPQVIDLLAKYRATSADAKDAAIAIERRWSTTGLDDLELLEALAKVYGLLSDAVLDAHIHLKQCGCIPTEHDHPDFRSVYHRTGTLECMAAGAETRTQVFKLSTGDQLSLVETLGSTSSEVRNALGRYGLDKGHKFAAWEKLDPIHFAEKVLYQAKRVLSRDKNHQRIMFIRDGCGEWLMKGLFARDRTEKHLLMRKVAQIVESKGCDAIVEVGEMWSAPAESLPQLDKKRFENVKGRGELLYVMVATREGIARTYMTPFTRGPFGGIKLGDTDQTDDKFPTYLQPVLEVWRRQGIVQFSNGKAMRRVWEPDALDVCFCGGPKRFGECCRRHLPLELSSYEIRDEIQKATTAPELARAEELSRAALAQYVIWVKQHTAVTMHIAQDLYRKLVDIDVLALEANIRQLQDSLEANGNAELFVPQVRYLASIIGVPRLSMRLVALASHWLVTSRRTEEAILELDSLGDMDKIDPDKIDDALALLTIAYLFDLSTERKEQFLNSALAAAVSEEEEWLAKLAIAEHILTVGRQEEALAVVDSIIGESQSSDGQVGVPPEALLLRWKITKTESDFQSLRAAIENSQGSTRRHYAAILIDEGLYTEAEQFLAADIDAGDPIAKLLITDARIRSGDGGSARDLFLSIEREHIPHKFQYAYAVASAHVAFSCKDERTRQLAILSLRQLTASGTVSEEVKNLLLALQSEKYPGAAPPESRRTRK